MRRFFTSTDRRRKSRRCSVPLREPMTMWEGDHQSPHLDGTLTHFPDLRHRYCGALRSDFYARQGGSIGPGRSRCVAMIGAVRRLQTLHAARHETSSPDLVFRPLERRHLERDAATRVPVAAPEKASDEAPQRRPTGGIERLPLQDTTSSGRDQRRTRGQENHRRRAVDAEGRRARASAAQDDDRVADGHVAHRGQSTPVPSFGPSSPGPRCTV